MTGDISDLLQPDLVAVGLAATARKGLFAQVGAIAASADLGAAMLDPRAIADALTERERQGSTGFGGGVAIPHARVAGLDRIVAVVVQLAQPIEFGAVDGERVDLVVTLLSPPDTGADHLKALARVSRRLRDRALLAKLRGAGSRDAFYAILTADEDRDAA